MLFCIKIGNDIVYVLILLKKGDLSPEVRAVMEVYAEAETSVKLEFEMPEWYQVKVEVHQSLMLSPLLFAIALMPWKKQRKHFYMQTM